MFPHHFDAKWVHKTFHIVPFPTVPLYSYSKRTQTLHTSPTIHVSKIKPRGRIRKKSAFSAKRVAVATVKKLTIITFMQRPSNII